MSKVDELSKLTDKVAVSYHQRYDPYFGVRPNNILEESQARALFDGGEKFSLLFGDPENPDHYMDIFKGIYDGYRRIDVRFLSELEVVNSYIVESNSPRFNHTKNEMLFSQGATNFGEGGKSCAFLRINDVISNGDLPSISMAPNRHTQAISVPWQDFYMGPPPSFDELIDGSFAARLPVITMPPEALLEPYRHPKDRKPSDPKRAPRGRFMDGNWVTQRLS